MGNVSESSRSSPETSYSHSSHSHQQAPLPPPIRRGGAPRAERPCDSCRRRKSRCSQEPGQPKCVLCTFHHRECTYLDEPQRRKRKRSDGGSGPNAAIATSADVDGEDILRGCINSRSPPSGPSAAKKHDTTKRAVAATASTASGTVQTGTGAGPAKITIATTHSLLDRTLGLHRTTHSKYIGASSLHDVQLLDLLPATSRPSYGDDIASKFSRFSKFRRVDASTVFISRPDSQTLFSDDDEEDLEAIEQIVRPHGPALVNLYFRIVHPSYPILHKGVFLEKYARTYKEFSPPLLAAVYVLAMDWWEYDRELVSSQDPPDAERLIKAATKTLTSVIHRPKLSTLQAGLLLLQRSGGDSWVLTSQVVAVAEELGLHLDCSSWNIPEWEKGLRRRITWAIYMQDKWGALIHGRPSHISSSNWQARRLTLDDFPESAADEDDEEGSTEVEKGRRLFMHLTVLTEIMAEALELLYPLEQQQQQGQPNCTPVDNKNSLYGALELVKPIAMKLRNWAADMPPGLRMEDVKPRKLCSNGYLHLSYFATEIVIHRCIVRTVALSPSRPRPPPAPSAAAAASNANAISDVTTGISDDDISTGTSARPLLSQQKQQQQPQQHQQPPNSKDLRELCRTAARARLDHAIAFVESLRPEHLQGFWWFASSKSLALIGVYGALLWATSGSDAEAEACRRKLEDFRWSLKVRAKSSSFLASAIREMDETLEDLDMKQQRPLQAQAQGAQGQEWLQGDDGDDDDDTSLLASAPLLTQADAAASGTGADPFASSQLPSPEASYASNAISQDDEDDDDDDDEKTPQAAGATTTTAVAMATPMYPHHDPYGPLPDFMAAASPTSFAGLGYDPSTLSHALLSVDSHDDLGLAGFPGLLDHT